MDRPGKLAKLTAAHAFAQQVRIVALERHGGKDTTVFVGKVIRIVREHGGRGAVKVVLDEDGGGTYVIGLTLIRDIVAGESR